MYSMRSPGASTGYHYSPPVTTATTTYNFHYDTGRPPPSPHRPAGPMATYGFQPMSPRRVNPALSANAHPPRPQYASPNNARNFASRNNRAEIDDAPIIDPRAFQYLHSNQRQAKKKPAGDDMESGIDSRPIINLDAVRQLERRRQQQLEKNSRLRGSDDGSKGGIDDRSIVDVNAFRYIEGKSSKSGKQGQEITSGIDDRPITNPQAFK